MNEPSDKARSMAALQLTQWMFLHLVGRGAISQEDAKRILERAIELNIGGDQDHVQVAKIFERMLSALVQEPDQSPRRR